MSKKKHPDGDLYLLQAIWQDDKNTYRHNNIFTRAHSVEEMFEKLAKSYPEWNTTDNYTEVGNIDGYWTNVTVFKVELSDTNSWRRWIDKKREERRTQIKIEERERDLDTIKRLVKKHGMVAMEVLAIAAEQE